MNEINKVLDSIEHGWEHSTARFLLLLSSVFVLLALYKFTDVQWLPQVGFLTLYCALAYYWLTTLRKHESLGKYAVGPHRGQVLLFTLISIFLFLFWVSSTWAIIANTNNKIDLISHLSLCLGVVSFAAWLIFFFWYLLRGQNNLGINKDDYQVSVWCRNCCKSHETNIFKGYRIPEAKCPNCGTESLVHISK